MGKAVKGIAKGFKKATKFVGNTVKKVAKGADKLTGGVVGKALKKTGLDKVGQNIINALPQRIGARVLRGDNLGKVLKDSVKGGVALGRVTTGGPLAAIALGKQAKQEAAAKKGPEPVKVDGSKIGGSFDKGAEFANKVLGKDGMGRLRGDKKIEELFDIKRKRMEEGISKESQEAMRSKISKNMNEGAYKAGLQSGAAMGGLKGGAADAQQAAMQANLMGKQADIARDIFLDAEKAKMAGEKDFSEATTKAQSYDIDAMRQEKALKGQFGMGFEQMASADRQAALGKQAAQAVAPQKSGGFLGNLLDSIF